MTPNQAKRVIRSLTYREELAQTIPTLKTQLLQLVRERGPLIVGGYRVWEHQGELIVKELPVIPITQLPLALEFVDEDESAEDDVSELCLRGGVCHRCERLLESPSEDCDCPCHAVVA